MPTRTDVTAPQNASRRRACLSFALFVCLLLAGVARAETKAAAPGAALTGEALEGSQLFKKLACATCHQGGRSQLGPALAGVYGSKVKLASGETVTADDAYIKESLLNPTAKVVAGFQPLMPAQKLDDKQVTALTAYIKTLKGTDAPKPGAAH